MKRIKKRSQRDRWREYERLKAELQSRQPPSAEYEAELRALAVRLKV